ncbi:hypothetical protein GGS20DRAFT_157223 [Poronia punctata]|nr:hypothetical protein GGS20DRAFT_157223 [Poronia punctata]
MQEFQLSLPSGTTLTGRHNLPSPTTTPPPPPPPPPSSTPETKNHDHKYNRPLIIALHGGSYTSAYFDMDSTKAATNLSNVLRVPFIAIDRSELKDVSSDNKSEMYQESDGLRLHDEILPLLWKKYGLATGCTSIVLHSHSMGVPSAIVAAGLRNTNNNNNTNENTYPLSGLIISGWGTQFVETNPLSAILSSSPSDPQVVFEAKGKLDIMLPPWAADSEIREVAVKINLPTPAREMQDALGEWLVRWGSEWADKVRVPVMVGIAGRDGLWKGTEEHVVDLVGAFGNSSRVDGSLIPGAPHNLEVGYWAPGWFARCFGFAVECALAHEG